MNMRAVHNQRGMALVLTLVALVLFSTLGLFLAVNSQTESQIVGNEQSAKRAFDIANAGLSHTFRLIGDNSTTTAYRNGFDDELSEGGTGGALAATGTTVVTLDDGNRYRRFSFGGGYYNVRAVDNYDDNDQSTDSDQRIMIISRGQYTTATGTAEKVVQAIALPATPCALTMEGRSGCFWSTSTDRRANQRESTASVMCAIPTRTCAFAAIQPFRMEPPQPDRWTVKAVRILNKATVPMRRGADRDGICRRLTWANLRKWLRRLERQTLAGHITSSTRATCQCCRDYDLSPRRYIKGNR